jgi:G3E family GTPase
MSVPCHLIAGPLGVGKTTCILHHLQEHSGREFTVVLTNDFGRLGVDHAVLDGALRDGEEETVRLLNVPGGCICCTSLGGLEQGLKAVLEERRPDRVIIEPSGLSLVGKLCPVLEGYCDRFGMTWMPVILLLDPGQFNERHLAIPYFAEMVKAADILVANRCDRCSAEAIEEFLAWTGAYQPKKMDVLSTSYGRLPAGLLDRSRPQRPASTADEGLVHGLDVQSGGQTWPLEEVFPLIPLREFLLAEGLLRFKGMLRTDVGWRRVEWASGEVHVHPGPAGDLSRAEWILDASVDATGFAQRLGALKER